jgi:hypothetical protein
MLGPMAQDSPTVVAVIDFRRSRMVLGWHALGGTWTALDEPPPRVHGIALIRGAQPNICLYATGGRLRLQVGAQQFALTENSPRLRCLPDYASLGLRRRFVVESSTGGVLFSQAYWAGQGSDFFRWLAGRADDPDWRVATARRWSDGVSAEALRAA